MRNIPPFRDPEYPAQCQAMSGCCFLVHAASHLQSCGACTHQISVSVYVVFILYLIIEINIDISLHHAF